MLVAGADHRAPRAGGDRVRALPVRRAGDVRDGGQPLRRPAPAEENTGHRARLTAHLEGSGLAWHPAVGGDPEGDHLEPGALVLGLDLEAARLLGARFSQAAVYVWMPDALHLAACDGTRHDVLGYRAVPNTRLDPP